MLEDEKLKWCQWAKQRWLKEGDGNTKYFHQCASNRKYVNIIRSIFSEEGLQANTQVEIAQAFQAYYMDLFSTYAPTGTPDLLKSFIP